MVEKIATTLLRVVMVLVPVWVTITLYLFKKDYQSRFTGMFIMTANFALLRALIEIYNHLRPLSLNLTEAFHSLILWVVFTGLFFLAALWGDKFSTMLIHFRGERHSSIGNAILSALFRLVLTALSFVILPYFLVWRWRTVLEFLNLNELSIVIIRLVQYV